MQNPPPESQKYMIAIYPPNELREYACRESQKFATKGYFVLDDTTYIPHVSLYHCLFSKDTLPEVQRILNNISSHTRAFPLEYKGVHIDQNKYIWAEYQTNPAIRSLQDQILESISPLRTKDPLKDSAPHPYAPLYGFTNVKEYFTPHITITSLQNPDPSLHSLIDTTVSSFTVDTIGLFTRGDHGTCTGIVELFSLKK